MKNNFLIGIEEYVSLFRREAVKTHIINSNSLSDFLGWMDNYVNDGNSRYVDDDINRKDGV